MSTRIYLNNRNNESSEVRVYRSTTRIEDNALPEPIAILPGNATYYDDPGYLFYDVDYHYRVAVTDTTGQVVLSPNKVHRLGLDTGPGPEELMYGDENLGVFGLIRTYEHNDILECFKALPTSIDHSTLQMMKFIRKGVIGYIPTTTINFRGDQYVSAGLLTGMDKKPPFQPINASRYVGNQTISGDRKFSWGLPRAISDQDYEKTAAEQMAAIIDQSRYNFANSAAGFSQAIDIFRLVSNPNSVRFDRKKAPCLFQSVPSTYTMYCSDNLQNGTSGVTLGVDSSGNVTTFASNGWSFTTTTSLSMLPIITYEGKA